MNSLSTFIDIHSHQLNSHSLVNTSIYNWIPNNLKETPPNAYYSFGIHPKLINHQWGLYLEKLEHLLNTDKYLLAIGETGLDKLSKTNITLQESIFTAHLELAEKHQKPIIVHCVKAHDRLLSIIKSIKPNSPVIIHGFNQKWVLAQKLLNAGLFLSFGHALGQDLSNASLCIEKMGSNGRFFLETDDKEVIIEQIYRWAAYRLNTPAETIADDLLIRFQHTFKIFNT